MSRIVFDARKIDDFGIGSYIRGLVSALAGIDGDEQYVLLGDPGRSGLLPPLPARFSWRRELAPGYSLRELWSVSRSALAAGAELFHAPHYVLPMGLRCPSVVTIHDLIHLRFPRFRTPLELLYARWTLARALRTARRVIAVSRATADELAQRYGALAARVVTIADGVDEAYFAPADGARDSATLARHGLAPGYLLFVGNPKPHKNLAGLAAAYRRLRRTRTGTPPLVLVGPATLPEEIAASGPTDGMRALGRIDAAELPAIYRGASCVVVASLWEGFGLAAAEAMACGTPTAVAARGALPEVVGDAAPTFDPESETQMVQVLAGLLDDPALRRRNAERGRARAARLRWRSAATATLAVYREVLAERRGATA